MLRTLAGSFLFGFALMAFICSTAAAFNKIDLPGTRTQKITSRTYAEPSKTATRKDRASMAA